jgi:hypothetical protein
MLGHGFNPSFQDHATIAFVRGARQKQRFEPVNEKSKYLSKTGIHEKTGPWRAKPSKNGCRACICLGACFALGGLASTTRLRMERG